MRHSSLLFILIFSLPAVAAQSTTAARPPWDIVFTQIPARPSAPVIGARIVLLSRDGSTRVLTPGFAEASDPAVSFDGKRILFTGRKSATDPRNIYEMNADGSDVRRITHDAGNCRSPIYQSPIFYLDDPGPMQQIAFVSDAPGTLAEYGAVPAPAIYSARMDGSGVRRLTYNPSGAVDPAMLPDGRMLFSGWERLDSDRASDARIELLAVNIDGTDYATFSGGQGRRDKRMACVIPGRMVLFVDADSLARDGSGPLGVLDLRRNLHSYRRLALPPAYLYHSPSALPDGTVLVSRRPVKGSGTQGIFRLDPETGKTEAVFDAPDMQDVQAHALVARTVPDGRSSVVDEKQPWAKLYCLNLYETDVESRFWPKGLVRRVRLLEGVPRGAKDAAVADLSPILRKRFLGEIDVDADGSFHAQIPANIPVQIQALDEEGMALRTSAWIWAKNKEQRGCIGCHEDGERTPENVMASALTRPGAMLMLAPDRRRTVRFDRDVAPILQQKCATAACHGGAARPTLAGKGGRPGAGYEALLEKDPKSDAFRYVVPGAARKSMLMWAVFGRNTARPWDHMASGGAPKAMPPAGSSALTAAEKRTIAEWIDVGAHYGEQAVAGGQR